MSRWIRVHTSIFEHDMFADEPFSEREAWLWLIAKAAWKETRHRIGNKVVVVPVGSVFLTLREMQSAWGWKSDYRVRSFLNLLTSEGMVVVEANAGKTQISLCNYDKYQSSFRDENASTTQPQRTENALKTPITPVTPISSSLRSEDSAAKPRADVGLFKAELTELLDAERLEAICAIRRKKKAAFSAHAGKLLFKALSACPDPRTAADEMILRNWTSVKPEWLEKSGSRQQATAPPRKSEFQLRQDRIAASFDRKIREGNRNEHYDNGSHGPTIDHEPGNWRPH